jgi:hypothetical protein
MPPHVNDGGICEFFSTTNAASCENSVRQCRPAVLAAALVVEKNPQMPPCCVRMAALLVEKNPQMPPCCCSGGITGRKSMVSYR